VITDVQRFFSPFMMMCSTALNGPYFVRGVIDFGGNYIPFHLSMVCACMYIMQFIQGALKICIYMNLLEDIYCISGT
jgi:hypothetical protein